MKKPDLLILEWCCDILDHIKFLETKMKLLDTSVTDNLFVRVSEIAVPTDVERLKIEVNSHYQETIQEFTRMYANVRLDVPRLQCKIRTFLEENGNIIPGYMHPFNETKAEDCIDPFELHDELVARLVNLRTHALMTFLRDDFNREGLEAEYEQDTSATVLQFPSKDQLASVTPAMPEPDVPDNVLIYTGLLQAFKPAMNSPKALYLSTIEDRTFLDELREKLDNRWCSIEYWISDVRLSKEAAERLAMKKVLGTLDALDVDIDNGGTGGWIYRDGQVNRTDFITMLEANVGNYIILEITLEEQSED